jgi:hypothetical protein
MSSELRLRMIEDMKLAGLAATTKAIYIDAIIGAHQTISARRKFAAIF